MSNETNNQNLSNSDEIVNDVSSANDGVTTQPQQNDIPENSFTSQQINAQDSIIAQLQAQNAALIQQNNLLNQQVINLVQSGGQLNNAQQTQPPQIQNIESNNNRPTQAQQLQAMGMQAEVPPKYIQQPSLSNMGSVSLEDLASEIGKERPKH